MKKKNIWKILKNVKVFPKWGNYWDITIIMGVLRKK